MNEDPPSLACVRTEVSRHTDITQQAPDHELDSRHGLIWFGPLWASRVCG